MGQFHSPRALVTGAASGIGRAVVDRLLDAGCRVAGLDRRPVDSAGEALVGLQVDVTDAGAVDGAYGPVADHLGGGLDLLVSSAGVGIHERLDTGDPNLWQRVVETNLVGTMRSIRAFVPLLEAEESSARSPRKDVIVISSVADRKPHIGGGAYSATKAGVSSLAETLRLELMPDVRVATIRPGMVDTAFFDHSIGGSSPPPEAVGYGAVPAEQVAEAAWFVATRPAGVAISNLTIRPSDQPF